MIKVASSVPTNLQPVANGFHHSPPPIVPIGEPPGAVVYSNPAVNAPLPEVNEPEKPRPEGETKPFVSG